MQKVLLLVFLVLLFKNSYSSEYTKVDSLIKVKKYFTAWKELEKKENKENKIDINLRKIDMCLKYHVKSISHQAFAFVNVPKGESLLKQKQLATQKTISAFPFKIDIILDSLIKEEPNNYKLYKAKGEYYYDIFILFEKEWIKNKQEVLRQMHDSFKKADENGERDYLSLYALGYFHTLNEQTSKAFEYFKRSINLDSSYAPAHYNLAYLYAEKDSNKQALNHALKAYNYYRYIIYKSDAGQMAGSILGKLGKHNEAISILLECDKIVPSNYQTYYYLLNSFLSLNKRTEIRLTTESMFNIDWKSHTINTDIIELYIKANHFEELINFYNIKLNKDQYNMEFRGHIQLNIAQAYALNSRIDKKLHYLNLARESFNICYDESHPIFRVLNKMEK